MVFRRCPGIVFPTDGVVPYYYLHLNSKHLSTRFLLIVNQNAGNKIGT
jgi:hypothetical protein